MQTDCDEWRLLNPKVKAEAMRNERLIAGSTKIFESFWGVDFKTQPGKGGLADVDIPSWIFCFYTLYLHCLDISAIR